MLIMDDKTTCPRCRRTVERDGPFMCPCGWRGRVDDEDASYFSSDLSRFVCGNCARECELSDDTPVVYGDIPIPFCSAPTNVKPNGWP